MFSPLSQSKELDTLVPSIYGGVPGSSAVKHPPAIQETQETRFDPWVRKIPWRRKWQPTPVFLSGKFHRQKSLAGYSPWSHKELVTTEQLSMHSLLDWFFGRGYAVCLTLSPWLAMGSLFISAPSAGQHPLPHGLGSLMLRLAAAAW